MYQTRRAEHGVIDSIVSKTRVPLTGSDAVSLDISVLHRDLSASESDILNALDTLARAVGVPGEDLTREARINRINRLQEVWSNHVLQYGEPPETEYSEKSGALASKQFNISRAIELLNDPDDIAPALRERMLGSLTSVISSYAQNRDVEFEPTFTRNTSSETKFTSLEVPEIDQTHRKHKPVEYVYRAVKDAVVYSTLATKLKPIFTLALLLGVTKFAEIIPGPDKAFFYWDGGAKQILSSQWPVNEKSLRFRGTEPANGPLNLTMSERINQRQEFERFEYDEDGIRRRVLTPEEASQKGASSSADNAGGGGGASSSSNSTSPFVPPIIMYLLWRYIINPLIIKKNAFFRPRNEGPSRHLFSPYRGRPQQKFEGKIETNNPNIKKALWITSVWDTSQEIRWFRLDRDYRRITLPSNAKLSRVARSLMQIAEWSLNQRTPFFIRRWLTEGSYEGKHRGPLAIQWLFGRGAKVELKKSWGLAEIVPPFAESPKRSFDEADVTFPIPRWPGREVSLPVPSGYRISAIDLDEHERLERSSFGTYRLRTVANRQGVVKYRISKGDTCAVEIETLAQLVTSLEPPLRTAQSEFDLVLAAREQNCEASLLSIARRMRERGTTISYSSGFDHIQVFRPNLRISISDAAREFSPEALGVLFCRRAAELGYGAPLVRGLTIKDSDNGSSFCTGESGVAPLIPSGVVEGDRSILKPGTEIMNEFSSSVTHRRPVFWIFDFASAAFALLPKKVIMEWVESMDRSSIEKVYPLDREDISSQPPSQIEAPVTAPLPPDEHALALRYKKTRDNRLDTHTIRTNSTTRVVPKSEHEVQVQKLSQLIPLQIRNELQRKWWNSNALPLHSYEFLRSAAVSSEAIHSDFTLAPPLSEKEVANLLFDNPEVAPLFGATRRTSFSNLAEWIARSPGTDSKEEFDKRVAFLQTAIETLNHPRRLVERMARKENVLRAGGAYQICVETVIEGYKRGYLQAGEAIELLSNLKTAIAKTNLNLFRESMPSGVYSSVLLLATSEIIENRQKVTELLSEASQSKVFSTYFLSNGTPSPKLDRIVRKMAMPKRNNRKAGEDSRGIDLRCIAAYSRMNFELGRVFARSVVEAYVATEIPTYRGRTNQLRTRLRLNNQVKIPTEFLSQLSENEDQEDTESATIVWRDTAFHESRVGRLSMYLRVIERLGDGMNCQIAGQVIRRTIEPTLLPLAQMDLSVASTAHPGKYNLVINGASRATIAIAPHLLASMYDQIEGKDFVTARLPTSSGGELFVDFKESDLLDQESLKLDEIVRRAEPRVKEALVSELREVFVQIEELFENKRISREELIERRLRIVSEVQKLDEHNPIIESVAIYNPYVVSEINRYRKERNEYLTHFIDDYLADHPQSSFSDESLDELKMNLQIECLEWGLSLSSNQIRRHVQHLHLTDGFIHALDASEAFITSQTLSVSDFFAKFSVGESVVPRAGLEFNGIRELQHGDSQRHVNQRLSARSGRKMINVWEDDEPSRIKAIVDLRWLGFDSGRFSVGDHAERLVLLLRAAYRMRIPTTVSLYSEGVLQHEISNSDLMTVFQADESHRSLLLLVSQLAIEGNLRSKSFGPSPQFRWIPRVTCRGDETPVYFMGGLDEMSELRTIQRESGSRSILVRSTPSWRDENLRIFSEESYGI